MSERDHRRQLAVGAGTSPADPGGHPRQASPGNGNGDVDVVRAVAALVNDLVEGSDDIDGPVGDVDDQTAPDPVDGMQQDLATGPAGTHGDAVAPWPDRGGQAVGPTAR